MTPDVSVIIPHGGAGRLANLAPVLARLHRCTSALEIILVEIDDEPRAAAIAGGLVHRHLWVRDSDFQRSRARNLGIPFAHGPFILWLNQDLLVPAGFIETALDEISGRTLDYLIPWSCVEYYAQPESSEARRTGDFAPDTQPMNRMFSRDGIVGSAFLARRDFILAEGGFDEGFRGWGGEDDAMMAKARLLGRAGITHHDSQILRHLYHDACGGHTLANRELATYKHNAALLNRIRSVRSAHQFRARFPTSPHFSVPWRGVRLVWAEEESEPVLKQLTALYGDAVQPAPSREHADLILADTGGQNTGPGDLALNAACRLASGSGHTPPAPSPEASVPVAAAACGENPAISIIIPQSGIGRLAALPTVLGQARRSVPQPEIILVEIDSEKRAAAEGRLADRHLWVKDSHFQRSRARNLGIPFASGDYILWLDNDIFIPDGFLARALDEITARKLDFLLPWNVIHYLSREDSLAVEKDGKQPHDCVPINSLALGRAVGGAVLVRRDFVVRFGAFDEAFLGWGFEDQGFFHRATVLGHTGTTQRQDQILYHLYHEDSYGNPGAQPEKHPDIQHNATLMRRMRACRTPKSLLARFPAPTHFSAPWTGKRRIWASDAGSEVLEALTSLYGDAILMAETPETADAVLCAPSPAASPREAALAAACQLTAAQSGAAPIPASPAPNTADLPAPALRNVYACLVHERTECITDLVKNLRYTDPESPIILYNGGRDQNLLNNDMGLWHDLGASVHPAPQPMKWGYLHGFALDSMAFALDRFAFDTLTIVDSDQLALRPGYCAFLSQTLRNQPNAGILSTVRGPHGRRSKSGPAQRLWREQHAWLPYLQRHADGDDACVYSVFWPSTVFTAPAARGLCHLWTADGALRTAMGTTRAWPTEEVLLPTLTAMLGYEVVPAPWSLDWVKFRITFTARDLTRALAQNDAFWIHPVPRTLDHPIRAAIRRHLGHYGDEPDS